MLQGLLVGGERDSKIINTQRYKFQILLIIQMYYHLQGEKEK